MCIFAQPVVSVTDTNIFARMMPDGWQYLVYQMNFESRHNNAIILPLPTSLPADEDGLKFVSLKDYGTFFRDLNRGFPLIAYPGARSRSGSARVDSKQKPKLAVHQVGDFIGSFVPALKDFDRLDRQFRVPQESWDKIPRYADYGFAVFQLKSKEGKPHPMAFKFRTRLVKKDGGSIFFPTVHIHDGEVHHREDFDHTLFLQAPEFDKACGDYQQRRRLVADAKTGYVRSKWAAGKFCRVEKSKGIIKPDALIHRLQIKGKLKNTDVLARLDLGHVKTKRSAAAGAVPAVGAIAGGAAALKWFCDRRDRVASASDRAEE